MQRLLVLVLFTVLLTLGISAPASAQSYAWAPYFEWTTHYSPYLEGSPTASGEIYYHWAHTCASWDYPLGSTLYLRSDGYYSWCIVNDRGPAWWTGAGLDISGAVMADLDYAYLESDWVLITDYVPPGYVYTYPYMY